MPQLVFIDGKRMGSMIELSVDNSIGRAADNTIVLGEGSVVDHHAKIRRDGRSYNIQRLDASGRLAVNGVVIDRKVLAHGDIISLGDVMLLFSDDSASSDILKARPAPGQQTSVVESRVKPAQTIQEVVSDMGDSRQMAMETLVRVAGALSQTLDKETVCRAIVQSLSEVFLPDRIFLMLYNERMELKIIEQQISARSRQAGHTRVSMSLVKEAIEKREGLLTADAMADERFAQRQSIIDQRIQSAMCVPIVQRVHVLGAIVVDQISSDRRYGRLDLRLLDGVSMQAAVALENVQRFEESREDARKLRMIAEASQKISASLDEGRIMRTAVEEACRTFGASKGSLLMLNPDNETMNVGFSNCIDPTKWPTIKIRVGEGYAGRVLRENRPLLTSDADTRVRSSTRPYETGSYLIVPVAARAEGIGAETRPLGVISLTDKPKGQVFDRTDLDLMQILAAQVGIALNNARVFEKATVDPLTRAFTRQYFFHKLESEIGAHRRASEALSLVMFDLDDFKQVNDTHGHPAGDAVLASIGALLRSTLEDGAFLGRYGGEEFALALPRAPIGRAEQIAGRMREAVAGHAVAHEELKLRITISAGVATLGDQDTGQTLVRKADIALYLSKRNGRDRVSVYQFGLDA